MDHTLVQTLACPQCGSGLTSNAAELDCSGCALSYLVREGVPVLLISAASVREREAPDPLFDRLLADAVAAPFSGWDLSWLADRCTTTTDDAPPLIDVYENRARELLGAANAVLDLGTGGGERLARLAPLSPVYVASEAYPPNVTGAALRLDPFGVHVVQADPNTHHSHNRSPATTGPSAASP